MKKLLVLLAVLFCLSFALFAAGAKEEKVTTITFWHSNSGILGDALDELVEKFNTTVGKRKTLKLFQSTRVRLVMY